MAVNREFTFLSADGKTNIYAREWLPSGPARACIVIQHGVAEYCDRYDAFAAFLADNGFAVSANDLLGHGRSVQSEEQLGFFAEHNGWDTVVRDARMLRDILKSRYAELPVFLFGHSMGSFLAQTYIMTYPDDFSGCILSGTGFQSPMLVRAGRLAAKRIVKKQGAKCHDEGLQNLIFAGYNKNFAPARTPYDWISGDDEEVDRYIADPLCGFTVTAGLISDMLGGLQFIADPHNAARVNKDMPIYLFSGDLDPVGSNGKGVKRRYEMYRKAGVKDVSMKLYPGGRHEMLNERNRDEVYYDVLAWLESKL